MRLYHYKLIPFLPQQMIISQWRECIAIKRQWEKGTLKHRLVSYVMDHDREYFMNYVWHIREELIKRNIKYQNKYYNEIFNFCESDFWAEDEYRNPIYPEHNHRYLTQCYFNLQEKYDRGIITEEEWDKIKKANLLEDVSILDLYY